jgi:hypothetical protein
LEGFEVLGLVGWPTTFFEDGEQFPEYELAVSLAGNAFSAFACLPVFIALLCAAGMPSVAPDESSSENDPDEFLLG